MVPLILNPTQRLSGGVSAAQKLCVEDVLALEHRVHLQRSLGAIARGRGAAYNASGDDRSGCEDDQALHRAVRLTVIVNCLFAVLPLESVAEQLTFVRPTLKLIPERGLQLAGTAPSAASLALTV